MSWLSEKTGRPKEQGGHKRINISVEKFVAEALKKTENKSRFIEKTVRPILEQLDPGEASVYLWQIDTYIVQRIIAATKNGNHKQVQALGWLADQLEDARKLCGIPPSNFKSSMPEKTLWKKQFFEHKDLIERAIAHHNDDDLINVPQAALTFLKADLPGEIREKLPELKALEKRIIRTSRQEDANFYVTLVLQHNSLKEIAVNLVPSVYGKALDLIEES